MTLVSPLNVNGTESERVPPFAIPAELENHAAASDPKLTVQLGVQPFICVPGAAVKTKAPLIKSRVVELASKATWNPDEVTFVILTEPGTMIGARAGTVIFTLGAPASGRTCALPGIITGPRVPTMSPATLPNWIAGIRGLGAVALAGIETAKRVVPSGNCISLYPAGKPEALGVKLRVNVAVMAKG